MVADVGWGDVAARRQGDEVAGIPDDILEKLERDRPNGITSAEILELFESHGVKFSEATFRKYVQVGLLPRSVRVGRKGKHQGSQGLYPATIVRRILVIKQMMADNLTIEEIQREFLFVRGDIEELQRKLTRIFTTLKQAAKASQSQPTVRAISQDLSIAEQLSKDLLSRLVALEERLTTQSKLARQAI
jgi:hypothetical protein